MSLREELVLLMQQPGANVRELCRRYGISPTTAYKWKRRYDVQSGMLSMADRSRRPKHSPLRSPARIEAMVLAARQQYPSWGGRKLAEVLRQEGAVHVPAPSTISQILSRHGLLTGPGAGEARDWQRFEHETPNELWQMDFKGHFATEAGRCHPLTVLDDHSRFNLALHACRDERRNTVRDVLKATFRRYGLPRRILCDNGAPWGDVPARHTQLSIWLMQLGICVTHGRPYHPQTQGKLERMHRTLLAEAIGTRSVKDLRHCQDLFDAWRHVYNHKRPHEALGLATPGSRYCISPRPFPEKLAEFDYGPDAIVRRVAEHGRISFRNQPLRVSKAFVHQRVALRPTLTDGVYDVFFCHQRIRSLDLRHAQPD